MVQIPLNITYRNVHKTDEIDQLVNEKAAKLEKVCDYISSCRVALEKPQEFQQSGNRYRVRLDLTVPPGHEIVVTKDPADSEMHTPLPVVIREAFDTARRQLIGLVEKQRQQTKTHPEQQAEAIVAKIFRKDGYGFIRTMEGRELYFHENSVLHGEWDRLVVGTGVSFSEEMGEKGPQATSVQITDKPGSRTSEEEEINFKPS